jgi:hypothetical protein
MPKFMCLTCGVVTDQTRCPIHRGKKARGYGAEHERSKKAAMAIAPYCWKCGCRNCQLQWHHVTELQGGRNPEKDDRRQLLCLKCHNLLREN